MKPFGELLGFVEGAVELVGREDGPDSVEEFAQLATPGVEAAARLLTGQERRGRPETVAAPRTANVGGGGLRGPLELVCNEAVVTEDRTEFLDSLLKMLMI